MTLREAIEKADKRLDLMGFDSIEKAIIFYSLNYDDGTYWLLSATEKEINEWYDNLTK